MAWPHAAIRRSARSCAAYYWTTEELRYKKNLKQLLWFSVSLGEFGKQTASYCLSKPFFCHRSLTLSSQGLAFLTFTLVNGSSLNIQSKHISRDFHLSAEPPHSTMLWQKTWKTFISVWAFMSLDILYHLAAYRSHFEVGNRSLGCSSHQHTTVQRTSHIPCKKLMTTLQNTTVNI